MENSKIEQLQADLATVKADRDAFGQNAIDLQKRLSELPSFIAGLERFEAEDGSFLRLADVEGAISECVGLRQPQDFNPEHTLFSEIRSSTTVNEDDEPTRYLITAEQLQRIRALEFVNASPSQPAAVQRLQVELAQTRTRLVEMHEVLTEAVVDAKAFLASDQGWKWYGTRRDEVEARYNDALSDADSFAKRPT
jgi:hypothetical protein